MLLWNRIQTLFRVLLLSVFILLLTGAEIGHAAQTQQPANPPKAQGRVPGEVREAVQNGGTARVVFSLRETPGQKPDMTPAQIMDLQNRVLADLAPHGFQMRRQYQGIPALAGTVNERALQALENNPHFTGMLPDFAMQKNGDNGRDAVGVVAAHASGFTGEGITVAVIDTGISSETGSMYEGIKDSIIAEHCFTEANCYPYDDFEGTSAQDGDGDPNTVGDHTGHGTLVTDIITGPSGYAPDTKIVSVRVLDDHGGGYLSDWLAGLDWVYNNHLEYGIDVINMSIGTVVTFPMNDDPSDADYVAENPNYATEPWPLGCEYAYPDAYNPDGYTNILATNDLVNDVKGVMQELVDGRIPIFVSSGNMGPISIDTTGLVRPGPIWPSPNIPSGEWQTMPLPACLSPVIAVAATYSRNIGRYPQNLKTYGELTPGFPACYDSVTSETTVTCFSAGSVDQNGVTPAEISAPGVHIVDLDGGGTATIYGTSFASPAAAGVAALMKQGATNLPTFNEDGTATIANDVSEFLRLMTETGRNTQYVFPSPGAPAPKLINAQNVIFGTDAETGILSECSIEIADGDVYSASGLVEKVAQANTTGETICLAPGGTYTLIASVGKAGLPNISNNVTINGRGATIQRSPGVSDFRLFWVEPLVGEFAQLTIFNTTLRNGVASDGFGGGAIYVNGEANVTLDGVTLENNHAETGDGGAISHPGVVPSGCTFPYFCFFGSSGSVQVFSSTLQNNSAVNGNGGAIATGSNYAVNLYVDNSLLRNHDSNDGGAIYAGTGYVTVNSSLLKNNHASFDGGGMYRYGGPGGLFLLFPCSATRIETTRFEQNVADENGGAYIHNAGSAFNCISNSVFNLNSAYDGGAVQLIGANTGYNISRTDFVDNNASFDGGAINVNDSSLTINTSALQGNSALNGGAIWGTNADTVMRTSTVSGNHVTGTGHAFYFGGTTPPTCDLLNGTCSASGDSTLHLINSTVTLNETAFFGSQMAVLGNTLFDVTYSSIVDNEIMTLSTGTVARFKGALVVGTSCSSNASVVTYTAETLNGINTTHNYSDNTSCDRNPDDIAYDPLAPSGLQEYPDGSVGFEQFTLAELDLKELADNGGPTKTIAIGPDSRAIGSLTKFFWWYTALWTLPPDCSVIDLDGFTSEEILAQDQRLKARNDSACDVGAFEYHLPEPVDDFVTTVTSDNKISQGFDEYEFIGVAEVGEEVNDPNDGANEPAGCLGTPPGMLNDSQHLNVSGTSIFRGLSGGHSIFRGLTAGQSIFRGMASGSVFMEISTEDLDPTDPGFDSTVGVYVGDELASVEERACLSGKGRAIFEISGQDAESEEPYRIMLWKQNPNDPNGDDYSLEITDITFKGCGDINGIPPLQCEALAELYFATSGEDWINSPRHYWLDTNRPCDQLVYGGWKGVTCFGGEVSSIDLSTLGADTSNLKLDPDDPNAPVVTPWDFFVAKSQLPVGSGIVVTTTSMAVNAVGEEDGLCSLPEAIIAANTDTGSGVAGECPAGNVGPDTITLGQDRVYQITVPLDYVWGGVALPQITTDITIMGNGSRIERSLAEGIPEFRIFSVTSGGHLTLDDVVVRYGTVASSGDFGGGIHVFGGQLTVLNSQLIGNAALDGGAIHLENGGPVTIRNSMLAGNRASSNGGGIAAYYPVIIENSLIAYNQATEFGGGIDMTYSTLTMTNSTLSNNSASVAGSGIFFDVDTGATGALTNVTLAKNSTAPNAGAIVLNNTITLEGVLMGSNVGGNCLSWDGTNGMSLGYNMSDDSSCAPFEGTADDVATDLHNADANIGPLTKVGGRSAGFVHILLPGSPALNRIPYQEDGSGNVLEDECNAGQLDLGAGPVTVDQVGTERETAATKWDCDVGAYEHVNGAPVAVADVYDVDYDTVLSVGVEDGVLANDIDPDQERLRVGDTNSTTDGVQVVTPPQYAANFLMQANGSFTYRPALTFHGQADSFTYYVTDGSANSDPVTVTINVGPIPATAPENLSVVAGLDTAPVFPTLHWTHRLSLGQTNVPGKWYRIVLMDASDAPVMDTWIDAKLYCKGVVCEVPLSEATTPQTDPVLPSWGLINGDYSWWVQGWYGPGEFSDWSDKGAFTAAIAAPGQVSSLGIDVSNALPWFTWTYDPLALYYKVRIRDAAGNVKHDQWYIASDFCDAEDCGFFPESYALTSGTYQGDVMAWGPGGFSTAGFSGAVSFTLPSTPPAAVVLSDPANNDPDPVTDYNKGEPVFHWYESLNATWYTVASLSLDTGIVFQEHFLGINVCEQATGLCHAKPNVYLKNGDWQFWVRAWGPGGFNGGDSGLWTQGAFSVAAQPATIPTSIAPNATATSLAPIFQWSRVQDASWYELQIWDTSNKVIINTWLADDEVGCDTDLVVDCLYQPSPFLMVNGQTYRWRVRAYTPSSQNGLGGYSNILNFTIDLTP